MNAWGESDTADAPGGGTQFRFVQLELPWALGPADGRYVLRPHAGEEPEQVLVLRTLGAPQRRLLPRRRRRRRRVQAQPPAEPVPTSRVTLVHATPLPDAGTARAWLARVELDPLVDEAVRVLNRVLHLHRVATADGWTRDVRREQALVARVGYGAGEQVADGRFAHAVEVPSRGGPRRRRTAALRPQERLAALLGGRDAALACEELVVRARTDRDAGRWREAALTLLPALDAALGELEPWRGEADIGARLDELAALHDEVEGAALRARDGGLDETEAAAVDRALGRLEAALRARTASGFQ